MTTGTSTSTFVARGRRDDEPEAAAGPGAGAGSGARRRIVVWVVALVLLVVAAGVLLASTPSSSDVPLAPDNAEPEGARAVAQILTERGVDVTYVSTTAAAIAEAEAGSTLLVVEPETLRDEQRQALADLSADMVLVDLVGQGLEPLTDRVQPTGFSPRDLRTASCEDGDALAADQVLLGGVELEGDVDASCFPGEDGGAGYVVWQEGERTWRVLVDGFPLSNAGLATQGNAALVLRALGQQERLVWYVPDPADGFTAEQPVPTLPVGGPVLVMLGVVAVAGVVWQARRLGPVVVEPLPVVVRASETTRGRGRLYRRAGAHAHAGAALRAGLISRSAGRVGLPSHAGRADVTQTLARASGREVGAVDDLLYGPPPTDDEGLVSLTHALDIFESEVVHR